jgi:hypothetical protein
VKQLKADGYEPILKGARWLLLKRPENLTDKQAVKMNELLQYNLKSIRSHLMKEDFQRFWEYHSPHWAGRFLDQWCTRAMRSRIEPMKKVARSIREKRELILNWFHMAFVPKKHTKPPSITTLEPYPSQNSPTNSAEEAVFSQYVAEPEIRRERSAAWRRSLAARLA